MTQLSTRERWAGQGESCPRCGRSFQLPEPVRLDGSCLNTAACDAKLRPLDYLEQRLAPIALHIMAGKICARAVFPMMSNNGRVHELHYSIQHQNGRFQARILLDQKSLDAGATANDVMRTCYQLVGTSRARLWPQWPELHLNPYALRIAQGILD